MKQYILIGVAVVCGILAFALVKTNLDRLKTDLYAGAKKVEVVMVKNEMLQGQVIEREDIAIRVIYDSDMTKREVIYRDSPDAPVREDYKQVIGQRLTVDLPKYAPLMWNYLDLPTARGSRFASTIKTNERAVTVPVDSTSSVSGLIRPNDHVDVIGTFRFPAENNATGMDTVTLTILQDVTILAVDKSYAAAASATAGRGYSTMTMSVTPEEAEMLIFAMEKGKLTFTLRNPQDVYYVKDLSQVNFQFLQKNIQTYMKSRADRLKLME